MKNGVVLSRHELFRRLEITNAAKSDTSAPRTSPPTAAPTVTGTETLVVDWGESSAKQAVFPSPE